MRASKEMARQAYKDVEFLEMKFGDLQTRLEDSNNPGLSARHSKEARVAWECLRSFLQSAIKRLPTEASYDRDAKRRRNRVA